MRIRIGLGYINFVPFCIVTVHLQITHGDDPEVPSEDCLYLTVATPALQEQAALQEQVAIPALQEQGAVDQNASLPVMVCGSI